MTATQRLEQNELGQLLAIKQMMLPHAPDDAHSVANAVWLYNNLAERITISVANGISKAFRG